MTNRTINLYDGLEALYYFDTDYWDGGANEISDVSGNERHATASGGPTVGANGPKDFEAASFDGTDDYFDPPNDMSVLGQEFTVFAIHDFSGWIFDSDDGSGGYSLKGDSFAVRDDNSNNNAVTVSNATNVIVGRFDNGTLMCTNGDEKNVKKAGITASQTVQDATIGVNNNFQFISDGIISVYACWTRTLNDAEVDALTRLTAPRRSL